MSNNGEISFDRLSLPPPTPIAKSSSLPLKRGADERDDFSGSPPQESKRSKVDTVLWRNVRTNTLCPNLFGLTSIGFT